MLHFLAAMKYCVHYGGPYNEMIALILKFHQKNCFSVVKINSFLLCLTEKYCEYDDDATIV